MDRLDRFWLVHVAEQLTSGPAVGMRDKAEQARDAVPGQNRFQAAFAE